MDNTTRRGPSGVFMALTGLIALMMLIVIVYGVASSNPDLVKHIIGADSASDDSGDMYSDDMYSEGGYYDEDGNYYEYVDGEYVQVADVDTGDGDVSDIDAGDIGDGDVSDIDTGDIGDGDVSDTDTGDTGDGEVTDTVEDESAASDVVAVG